MIGWVGLGWVGCLAHDRVIWVFEWCKPIKIGASEQQPRFSLRMPLAGIPLLALVCVLERAIKQAKADLRPSGWE